MIFLLSEEYVTTANLGSLNMQALRKMVDSVMEGFRCDPTPQVLPKATGNPEQK